MNHKRLFHIYHEKRLRAGLRGSSPCVRCSAPSACSCAASRTPGSQVGIRERQSAVVGRQRLGPLAEALAPCCRQDAFKPAVGLQNLHQRRLHLGETGLQASVRAAESVGIHALGWTTLMLFGRAKTRTSRASDRSPRYQWTRCPVRSAKSPVRPLEQRRKPRRRQPHRRLRDELLDETVFPS